MIKDKLKVDDAIIKQLDLKRISRLICNTDKGILELTIRKGETSYFLTLDSVPLSKEDNKTLMDLLFPVAKMEVPKVNKEPLPTPVIIHNLRGKTEYTKIEDVPQLIKELTPKKKGGRPKGSINKKKIEVVDPETNEL